MIERGPGVETSHIKTYDNFHNRYFLYTLTTQLSALTRPQLARPILLLTM
jgi:hypothetical protein